jgi:sensor histidine kinase YesM
MSESRKYNIILFISGILIVIFLNTKWLWYISDLLSQNNGQLLKEAELKLYYIFQQFIIHFFAFQVIAFYNFTWKSRVTNLLRVSKLASITLVIAGNLFLFFFFALIPSVITKGFSNVGTITYFFFVNFFVYVLAVSVAYLFVFLKQMYGLKTENQQLKTEKAKAELITLKEQLSPHFFFNTLNSLSAVIRTAEKSDSLEFVERLSQVYRYILDSGNKDLVSLKEEIGFLNDYSYLLHKRFGDNFSIENRMDSNILDYKIPPLALQVLLENVTKHNKLLSSCPVKISIENTQDYIHFKNELRKKENVVSHGSGLYNLNKRYQMICGQEIEISDKNNEFCVKIPIIK